MYNIDYIMYVIHTYKQKGIVQKNSTNTYSQKVTIVID
jgi:hypothetical protein